jgi:hypothetical protein
LSNYADAVGDWIAKSGVDKCPQATLAKLISVLKCLSIEQEIVTAINIIELNL